MPHSEDTQPGPAWCLAEEDRDGIGYICTRETHRGGVHKMVRRADMPDKLRDALAARTVAALANLDDTAELVIADEHDDPPSAVMQTMHELAELVGLAEIDRRFDMLSYTTKTLIGVAEELRTAKLSLADDRPVDPAVMERIKKRVDAWLLQIGAREDGGA